MYLSIGSCYFPDYNGTQSDDGGGAGGVALDWVFTVEGGARVRMCWDGRGVMQGGRNESGWVRIGESLTSLQSSPLSCYGQEQYSASELIQSDSNWQ